MKTLVDYSQIDLPEVLRRLLPDHTPPFVIDVGAGDGFSGFRSRAFLDQNWRGLLVEPDPETFSALAENCRAFPNARCLRVSCPPVRLTAVLSEEGWPLEFGILLIAAKGRDPEVLSSLDFKLASPVAVVTQDGENNLDLRRSKYAFLRDKRYRFCGVVEGHSIWLRRQTRARRLSFGGIQLFRGPAIPDEYSFLESAGPGQFYVETPEVLGPSPDGPKVLAIPPLADVTVSGWIIGDPERPVPKHVLFRLRSHESGAIEYIQAVRVPRPDVAGHFGNKALLLSGFRGSIRLRDLGPGRHLLSLVQLDTGTRFETTEIIAFEAAVEDFELRMRVELARKHLCGNGIEIGALQNPLALPPRCTVRYLDWLSLEGLHAHYPELKGLQLTAPDLVCNAEMMEAVEDDALDFVIANHFLEHCEDPIRTIENLLRVLKRQGFLYMAVPLKPWTFDHQRPVTAFEVLREAYQDGKRANRAFMYLEWARCVRGLEGQSAVDLASALMAENNSIHFNVWGLEELLSFLLQSKREFGLPFELVSVNCNGQEAILLLQKCGSP